MTQDLGPPDGAILDAYEGGFSIIERPFEPTTAGRHERDGRVAAGKRRRLDGSERP